MVDFSFYKFEERTIIKQEKESDIKKNLDFDWANLYFNNRKDIASELDFLKLPNDIVDLIITPENYLLTKASSHFIIQNIVIPCKENIYKKDYITIIALEDITVCIFPENFVFNVIDNELEHIKKQFSNMRLYYTYLLSQSILTHSTMSISDAKKLLYKIEQDLLISPEKVTSSQIIKTLNNIYNLSEIIENQFLSLKYFYDLVIDSPKDVENQKLYSVINSFTELNRIAERLDEKAESLRMQFMLIHQEESAHKINVLTIIQAIFVPLTFVAGVYGMNFDNMPELKWEYAYFIVWGIFIGISLSLIYYFRKNGWFD
jgi:magnesium transporter